MHNISSADFAYFDDLRCQLHAHPSWIAKFDEWHVATLSADWSFVDDLLLFRQRIFVPADFPSIHQLFSIAHSVGHEGITELCIVFRLLFTFQVIGVCFGSSFAFV